MQFHLRHLCLVPLVPLVLFGVVGCHTASAPAESSGPSVILLSLDTCRADVFGVLTGSSPSRTPHLDAFAADSVVFEKAFVQAPHTLPSHMSLMTSVYPDVHGVWPKKGPLPGSFVTLAELLEHAGYHTIGLVTSEWLKADFGFGRGFDEYERLPHERTYADRVDAAALRRLRGAEGPRFLFLHYYDLHSDFEQGSARNKLPYYSPPEFRRGLSVSADGHEFCDAYKHCNTRFLMAADRERRSMSPAEIQTIHDLYLANVPYVDLALGAFFDELKERGLYDGSLIIVTADHGEEFREHGRFIHSQPYDETIHVPLFIKFPKSWKAGTRVSGVVETVDIMPTILDYLGIAPPKYSQGESLLGLVEGRKGRRKHAVLSQDTINPTRYGLRTDDVKFIMNLKTRRRELYDLRADPGETVNLVARRPELAAELERRLKKLVWANRRLHQAFARDEAPNPSLLSSEERERLKSLGYLN